MEKEGRERIVPLLREWADLDLVKFPQRKRTSRR